MKRRWLFVTLLLLVTLLGACARAKQVDSWTRIKQEKRVIIGLDDSFVPMGFRLKNGELSGFDIDLARELFKRQGITAEFQSIDWSMKETELKNQTIDLIWNGYSVNPQRAQQVAFSQPYLKNRQILVVKSDSGIRRLSDLRGKTIGAQTGSSGATALAKDRRFLRPIIANREAVLYDTFNDAFLDLNAGRIQGILIDSVYGEYELRHQGDADAYRIIDVPYDTEDFAVGLRKGDTVLQRQVNAGLEALRRDGTLERLKQKWFGDAK